MMPQSPTSPILMPINITTNNKKDLPLDSTTETILFINISEGQYNYKNIKEIIREIITEPEFLYLSFKQDLWPKYTEKTHLNWQRPF